MSLKYVTDSYTNDNVRVGDLVVETMCYAGITNVFYRVVAVNGKQSVSVAPIGRIVKDYDPMTMQSHVRPDYSVQGETVMRRKVHQYVYEDEDTGEKVIKSSIQMRDGRGTGSIIRDDDPEYWWLDDDAD